MAWGDRGSRVATAVLDEDKVREIKRAKNTATIAVLATKYGVSKTTIHNVLTGKQWGWVKI